MEDTRAKIAEILITAEKLLITTEVPIMSSHWYYAEGSDSVEGFCESMKVVRKLCLKAMRLAKEGKERGDLIIKEKIDDKD